AASQNRLARIQRGSRVTASANPAAQRKAEHARALYDVLGADASRRRVLNDWCFQDEAVIACQHIALPTRGADYAPSTHQDPLGGIGGRLRIVGPRSVVEELQ